MAVLRPYTRHWGGMAVGGPPGQPFRPIAFRQGPARAARGRFQAALSMARGPGLPDQMANRPCHGSQLCFHTEGSARLPLPYHLQSRSAQGRERRSSQTAGQRFVWSRGCNLLGEQTGDPVAKSGLPDDQSGPQGAMAPNPLRLAVHVSARPCCLIQRRAPTPNAATFLTL